MRRVLATAGHVDHGKSTLVRALTGRDPDRLREERERGLTIQLGYAWTTLPSGAEVAFVDVPGHQRFVGTMLSGLGPAPAVVFVVAADQGWQAQSSEHLAAVRALGITDGLLVLTRCDLADDERIASVRDDATRRLTAARLEVPAVEVAATTGLGMDSLRGALDGLAARLPEPDPGAPVRLWGDRSFSVAGAGTVVTGTLGAGTVRVGDRLTLLDHGRAREVTVRGLHSQDSAHEEVGPVSRVAVNLRRVESDEVGRSLVLLTPGAFELAATIDVALTEVGSDDLHSPMAMRGNAHSPRAMPVGDSATLHVGSIDVQVHVRPLEGGLARLSADVDLPWRVGDRAILRDAGSRRLWAVRVLDVGPLPLARRGAAGRRGQALTSAGRSPSDLAEARITSRSADRADVLERLGLDAPSTAVRQGDWWVDKDAVSAWRQRLGETVRAHHTANTLSAGVPIAEAARSLDLPDHLPAALGHELVHSLAAGVGLAITNGRVHDPDVGGLGPAEAAISAVEDTLRGTPFVAPERGELDSLGLGAAELAAAERLGRILRLPDDVVLLPDGPARAMRVLAGLEQPFTLSQARQALGTTRRVAVPLLEHLDARGWTRRVDGNLREVVR
ncbi:translation elongation factor [Janibacter sp. Soil728]|uniref:selenocysteine-specific translation elongation factor n=1 Tax=Janibacter sp. Soil728 TaxID=1736393 RepID=UPI0006F62017|nr:selenocysteine-specific translation elongation factor [Janibacter sp. Soil728]KRE39246.1 translation elongation factor [Janibacter sp. Soil728]